MYDQGLDFKKKLLKSRRKGLKTIFFSFYFVCSVFKKGKEQFSLVFKVSRC